MPKECSLLLEVYHPVSIYDDTIPTVDWEVSSDPDHPFPFLLEPRNYASQEIDPIKCTATIGTVEVGVIDVPEVAGNQSTGFMTARVHDLLGRRCRLRRWIGDVFGWATLADGPAGVPKMDASYAAYRWSIRDTRDIERKLGAFGLGGVSGIAPRGAIYGFGQYTDDTGDHLLLERLLDNPLFGVYQISSVGAYVWGYINFASTSMPDQLARLTLDEDGLKAVQLSELATGKYGVRNADILWRVFELNSKWNVSRPMSPATIREPFVGTTDFVDTDGKTKQRLNYVTLFVAPSIPHGFPTLTDTVVACILRYRGPANEAFPYYVEDDLGVVLRNLYDGVYSKAPTDSIDGFLYDPLELENVGVNTLARISYDTLAFDAMSTHVMLRQIEEVEDVRAWAETALYAPSGWIPALDQDMFISPVLRTAPESLVGAVKLKDDIVAPAPDWQSGNRTVSEILYKYSRFFVPPDTDLTTERKADGLAIRDVDLGFEDFESGLRYGPQVEEYDASAFSAVGTDQGIVIPGQLETASILCQTAKFDVLDRFRSGVQSVGITVMRDYFPTLRVGDWVPAELMYLPDRNSGLRGSHMPIAQVVSLRDEDCTWRTLIIEESPVSDGPPGLVTELVKLDDGPSAGGITLRVFSDVESLLPDPPPDPDEPPPSPPGPDEPVFGFGDTMWYQDDFTGYGSAHQMWLDRLNAGPRFSQTDYGEDVAGIQLLDGGPSGSGKMIRFVYTGGVAHDESHELYLRGMPTLPDSTVHVFEYWARVTMDTPLNDRSDVQSVAALKWFMAWHRDPGPENMFRIQWNTHDYLPGALPPVPVKSCLWEVYDTAETAGQAHQPVEPWATDIFNSGTWHRFKHRFKPNSYHGARDGYAQMWIDGVKMIDISAAAVGVTPVGGWKTWCEWDDVDALGITTVNFLKIMGNLTTNVSGFTVDWTLFKWWTPA